VRKRGKRQLKKSFGRKKKKKSTGPVFGKKDKLHRAKTKSTVTKTRY